jgi:hypothetical protein
MRRLLSILAVLLVVAALVPLGLSALLFHEPAQAAAPLTTPVTAAEKHAECLRLDRSPPDFGMLETEEFRAQLKRWSDICKDAYAANASDDAIMLSLGRVMMARGERAEALPLFRKVAAKDNVVALKEIFEFYKSWDRDLSKPRLVTRADAEAALRRAAELNDAEAILMLTVRLDRGTLVKRNATEARIWAARGVANPPKDTGLGFMQTLQARLLASSDKDEERARGLLMLNELIKVGRVDAKTHLARAIRTEDPVRARRLLDEATNGDPGGAVPPLADMLIKGEGGPVDAPRAVTLLKTKAPDVPGVRAAYGQLLLDGKLVPRDVKDGVLRILTGAQFDLGRLLQAAQLLAVNPDVKVSNPTGFLFDLTEAADLGEPGFVVALADLKLSEHAQFADRAGGCALIAAAEKNGETIVSERAALCRAK